MLSFPTTSVTSRFRLRRQPRHLNGQLRNTLLTNGPDQEAEYKYH